MKHGEIQYQLKLPELPFWTLYENFSFKSVTADAVRIAVIYTSFDSCNLIFLLMHLSRHIYHITRSLDETVEKSASVAQVCESIVFLFLCN